MKRLNELFESSGSKYSYTDRSKELVIYGLIMSSSVPEVKKYLSKNFEIPVKDMKLGDMNKREKIKKLTISNISNSAYAEEISSTLKSQGLI